MNNARFLLSALLITFPMLLKAQGIDYSASWLGSSTGAIPWMQNFINSIQVDPDGTVYTTCGWDEGSGGPRNGAYKDGNILANHNRNINNKKATDNNGHVWTILNAPGDEYPTGNDTIVCDDGRFIADVDGPTGLAISNDGLLMVSEFGIGGQVHFYDVSGTGTPALHHTLGDSLGFLSGDMPGKAGDLRFRELTGVGTDASGNIYVSMSSFFGGCRLESYTPAGKKNWGLNGLMFVDNGDFDPTTDGRDIYTKSHHFVWDSTKPSGQEWRDTAYTLNRFKYPDDARLNTVTRNPTVTTHPSSAWIRYVDGKKIMIVNDMYTEQLRMYRFDPATDGETAIPSVFYARWNLLPWVGNLRHFQINNNAIVLATDFDEKYGTNPGVTEVGGIQAGQWLAYDSIDFGNTDTSTFTVNYSCVEPWPPCRIEIHTDAVDGRIIGNLQTARTGSNDIFQLFSTKLSDTITGIHKLYLIMKHPTPNKWPATQPVLGQWLWSDANGNGKMDYGEYQVPGTDNNSLKSLWVDKAMDLWMLNKNSITKVPFTGLGASGNPTYNMSAAVTVPTISQFQLTGDDDHGVIEYDSDKDIMYMVSSKTFKAAKFSNWSTNTTTPDWIIPVSGSQSMSIAGDYLFTIHGSTNIIYVYGLSDGKFAGKINPVGPIGLIDIPYGVRAFKRSNGEYIVLAEEDSKGKILVYRFSSFLPNTPPAVHITKPTDNQQFTGNSNIPVAISASDADGSISKVQLFIDDSLVSQSYQYSWPDASPGEHSIFARAFDNYGDSTTSDTVHVNLIATGIDSKSAQINMQLYPNPANDKVFIHAPDEVSSIDIITIVDLQGRIILVKKNPSLDACVSEIDVSGIPNGIYQVRITSGKITKNLKMSIYKP